MPAPLPAAEGDHRFHLIAPALFLHGMKRLCEIPHQVHDVAQGIAPFRLLLPAAQLMQHGIDVRQHASVIVAVIVLAVTARPIEGRLIERNIHKVPGLRLLMIGVTSRHRPN
jgi:hypothetical protein